MTDPARLLDKLGRLRDKPNEDVDFSFTNYTAQQLQFAGTASIHKYDTRSELERDNALHGASTLHERQIANLNSSNIIKSNDRSPHKPVDFTPGQWKEALEQERAENEQAIEQQKALNLNLRQERLAALTRSAIGFGTKLDEVRFQKNAYISPTYTTDLNMTQEKLHKRFYPQEETEAKNAILQGTLPEIYRRQKGFAQCAPQPRGFDIVNQNRVLSFRDGRVADKIGDSQVILTSSQRAKVSAHVE